jgi:hypothetical protein
MNELTSEPIEHHIRQKTNEPVRSEQIFNHLKNKCAEYLDLLGKKTWLKVGLHDNLHLQLGPDQTGNQ